MGKVVPYRVWDYTFFDQHIVLISQTVDINIWEILHDDLLLSIFLFGDRQIKNLYQVTSYFKQLYLVILVHLKHS